MRGRPYSMVHTNRFVRSRSSGSSTDCVHIQFLARRYYTTTVVRTFNIFSSFVCCPHGMLGVVDVSCCNWGDTIKDVFGTLTTKLTSPSHNNQQQLDTTTNGGDHQRTTTTSTSSSITTTTPLDTTMNIDRTLLFSHSSSDDLHHL